MRYRPASTWSGEYVGAIGKTLVKVRPGRRARTKRYPSPAGARSSRRSRSERLVPRLWSVWTPRARLPPRRRRSSSRPIRVRCHPEREWPLRPLLGCNPEPPRDDDCFSRQGRLDRRGYARFVQRKSRLRQSGHSFTVLVFSAVLIDGLGDDGPDAVQTLQLLEGCALEGRRRCESAEPEPARRPDPRVESRAPPERG